MTTLDKRSPSEFVKLLLLGDSKVGKTSSLVSLVEAGYKLRILDFDNLLNPLAQLIEERCPSKIGNVEYRTLRDKWKSTKLGPVIDGSPKAYIAGIEMLDHWKYTDVDGTKVDLGKPYTWGPDCILVVDSLSRFCDSAFHWREPLTPRGRSGEYDGRATYGDAQNAIEHNLANLTGEGFGTNVIVICHGVYQDNKDGTTKIFPQGVGQKLSPKIPTYFPAYVRYRNIGGKRTIQLKSDPMIDLANPMPKAIPDSLPADTGLATIFEAMQGPRVFEAKLRRA